MDSLHTHKNRFIKYVQETFWLSFYLLVFFPKEIYNFKNKQHFKYLDFVHIYCTQQQKYALYGSGSHNNPHFMSVSKYTETYSHLFHSYLMTRERNNTKTNNPNLQKLNKKESLSCENISDLHFAFLYNRKLIALSCK